MQQISTARECCYSASAPNCNGASSCLRVHFGEVPEVESLKARKQLERDCGQDTEGMILITDALLTLSG